MSSRKPKADFFKELAWDDLQKWAGSRVLSRGQSYHRGHRVTNLVQTLDGDLVAWVLGGEEYATRVYFDNGELISTCTCPYGGTCKHAVAVVLEYLDRLKNNVEVPLISKKDERLELLKDFSDERDWDGEEDEGESDEQESSSSPSKKSARQTTRSLKDFLEGLSRDQLVNLVEELAGKYSVVQEDLQHRQDLSKGSLEKVVTTIRKEIRQLSLEPAWRNHWNDEGHIPDYSRVKDRLESLLIKGHADEVVGLGKELLKAGIEQVGMSHDEGETGNEISSCMEIVFRALSQSSLPPVEQMLWVIEAELEDEYELCYGSESFWKKKQKTSDWSAVADILSERLKKLQPAGEEDSYSRDYRRDGLSNWIIRAFENAGRNKEIIPLCEQEAVRTGSYQRLVDALRKARRFEEAEQWIHRGIKATQKELPGIAKHLRDTLREMREKKGDWLKVAAFRVDDFLGSPSLASFDEMRKASERAKVWPAVRSAAILYLEKGKLPQTDSSWPLPEGVTEKAEIRKRDFPMAGELVDIAIAEKRIDDVLRWHDYQKSKKKGIWGWDNHQDESVAKVVADRYPDRALAIWKNLAESQIALTKPSAYETAAGYLRKVRTLLKELKRESEWQIYSSQLRQTNIKKRSFLQVLDRLDRRPIIKT